MKKIRDSLQLDSPLTFILATRVWQTLSGPLTIVLLIRALTLPEQGVYYAIIAIVGIQAYFELGLLNVLVSHSGHEYAGLNVAESSSETAEKENPALLHAAARMRDLIRSSFQWFGYAAIVYAVCAAAFGWFSLSDSNVDWLGPLMVIIPIAAVSVALAPAMAILEGAGSREFIYRFRFVQTVLGSLVVWLSLLGGLGLWTLVTSSLVQATMAIYMTFGIKRSFFTKFRKMTTQPSSLSWTQEVLPVQWRMALISTTFHFATQSFVFIVIMFHGDAEAAPLGMTLSVTVAIQMLALSWVQSKYPVVAAHHGAGNRERAGTIWRHTSVVSTCILILGFATLAVGIAGLPLLETGVERRFLLPWQILVIGIACLANHIASVQAFYVISRKANPLLAASLVGYITIGLAVWIGGYLYSTPGVVIGYALATSLVFLPLHSWSYSHFRKRTDL